MVLKRFSFVFFVVFISIQTCAQVVIPKAKPIHSFKSITESRDAGVDETEFLDVLSQNQETSLSWYFPMDKPGEVGQFEKLEIGVSFDSLTEAEIQNHTMKRKGKRINPFNPDELDVYAEFWFFNEGNWYGPIRVNGFYFQDYDRVGETWEAKQNDHLFRIRFAPEYQGSWLCRVKAVHQKDAIVAYDEFTFECVASSNPGFTKVGENKRYLVTGNEPFYPIGQNLTGPNNPSHSLEWGVKTAGTADYLAFQASMTELANAGGNYFRYIVSPWQTEIEFEELGNYSNRMSNAWEFDQILDHAKVLDLKMHMNLAMHYSFEAPGSYAITDWDWSAKGDSLNPANVDCFKQTDQGYCYRNELNLENPLDFLTDSTAMIYYKRRLRYMVARWGYSTNIAVMELLSEANNFGNEAIIELKVINGKYGCYTLPDVNNKADTPYRDSPETTIPKLMAWQIEMCKYLKEDLAVTQHPIAVSYTGEPDFVHGDSTYYSPHVDIATFNNYGVSIDKYVKNYLMVTSKYHGKKSGFYLDKPFMHSEYGPAGTIMDCDKGIRFIKTVNLTPFTGLAGSGINWHFHWNEDSAWNYLKPIKELLDSIPLDAENWEPGYPIVFQDQSIEIFYLKKPKADGSRKIVGAISNRTYNFYTIADSLVNSDCRDDSTRAEIKNNPIYQSRQNYLYEELSEKIKLPNLGPSNHYYVDWINALTGESLGQSEIKSTMFGRLELEFPGKLTGDGQSPILFFKIYPVDDPFSSSWGNSVKSTVVADFLPIDSLVKPPVFTRWN